jgi:hypothetical protein
MTKNKTNMTNKIATFITLSLLALASPVVAGEVQTNTPPVISGPAAGAWSFITTAGASNWIVAPYAIYDDGNKEFGAGVGVGYQISQFVVPTLRMDYLDEQIWMPSASLQLQVPVTIMGKFTATPFAFAGMATPIGGQHDENGSLVGIYGVGLAITLKQDRLYLLTDVEQWNGAHFSGLQYRAGIGIKF